MPQITRHFQDLNFNFLANPVKKDLVPLVDAADIKQSVVSLVLTNHYERPFHPEIGSGIVGLLFENVNPLTISNVQRAISEVLTNFEPRVTLQSVVVSQDLNDETSLNATITYFINNNTLPVTISIVLELLR